MPGVLVVDRDHPVFGYLAGDPPPPIGPVTALGGLDVLPGDQGQQRHDSGSLLVQLSLCQRRDQPVRVVHRADTSASFAAGSCQSIRGLPGWL